MNGTHGKKESCNFLPLCSARFRAFRILFSVFVAGLLCQSPSFAAQNPISIRWIADKADAGRAIAEVSGIDRSALQRMKRTAWSQTQWQQLFAVYTEPEGVSSAQLTLPMLGAYSIEGNVVRFTPRFPLEPGLSYRAVFNPNLLPGARRVQLQPVSVVYQRPRPERAATTTVSRIYPSANTLPENLLKFYIQFSAPMSRGRIYDHIRLLDADGRAIELPFLEIDEELWDAEMTRLTLFIDPGRIKRGVLPLEEVGPSLETGKHYTLVISREWRDAKGDPLREDFEKRFSVDPPDREPPVPARWRIHTPPEGTREPLIVDFAEPMDHALALRVIQIEDESGRRIVGKASLADEERRWMFAPEIDWRGGRYHIAVQTTIEDLAGNNIGKPFEVDLFEDIDRHLKIQMVRLPFEIR